MLFDDDDDASKNLSESKFMNENWKNKRFLVLCRVRVLFVIFKLIITNYRSTWAQHRDSLAKKKNLSRKDNFENYSLNVERDDNNCENLEFNDLRHFYLLSHCCIMNFLFPYFFIVFWQYIFDEIKKKSVKLGKYLDHLTF